MLCPLTCLNKNLQKSDTNLTFEPFTAKYFTKKMIQKNRFADYLIFRCVLLAGINAGPWAEGERKRLVNIFVVCLEASKGGIWLPTIL